jgi:hypothetical protein
MSSAFADDSASMEAAEALEDLGLRGVNLTPSVSDWGARFVQRPSGVGGSEFSPSVPACSLP